MRGRPPSSKPPPEPSSWMKELYEVVSKLEVPLLCLSSLRLPLSRAADIPDYFVTERGDTRSAQAARSKRAPSDPSQVHRSLSFHYFTLMIRCVTRHSLRASLPQVHYPAPYSHSHRSFGPALFTSEGYEHTDYVSLSGYQAYERYGFVPFS